MTHTLFSHLLIRILLIPVVITGFYSMSDAQSILFHHGNTGALRLELNKPIFEEGEDIGFLTLGNFFNAQIPLSSNLHLTAELPFAFSNFDNETESAIGNLGLGLAWINPQRNFMVEFGGRIPTSSDNEAVIIGFYTDLAERIDAYPPDYVPLKLLFNYLHGQNKEQGFIARLRAGFTGLITTDNTFNENELYFNIGVLPGYAFSQGIVQAGVVSTAVITEEDLDFSDRFLTNLVFSGEFLTGRFRPGLVIRVPMNEVISDVISLSVGLSMTVLLSQ